MKYQRIVADKPTNTIIAFVGGLPPNGEVDEIVDEMCKAGEAEHLTCPARGHFIVAGSKAIPSFQINRFEKAVALTPPTAAEADAEMAKAGESPTSDAEIRAIVDSVVGE